MSNKKILVIILSAVLLSATISVGAYKIFTRNSVPPSLTNDTQQNFETVVDSIDYSENLLDSNAVYKEKFDKDLSSQGRWIPIKSTDLIKELTTPQSEENPPAIQNVSDESSAPLNTSIANNKSEIDNDETFEEEVSTTNLSSANDNVSESQQTEKVKIVYIWQPNECTSRTWNPYSEGQWEFTCAGWVWASNYGWGRHCYNYGRWMWTSYYGWVWMPGGRWAPNWVTWRYCGNYYGNSYYGWYPTCPVVYWQNYQSHLIVCNSHFTSNPVHWTFVTTTNITAPITKSTILNPTKNGDILKNSGKVKVLNTLAIDETKIKYNGPNVTQVSEATKQTIIPKNIEIPITKSTNNSAGTKQDGTTDPPVKIKYPTKKNEVIDPVKLTEDITRMSVTSPTPNNGTRQTTTTNPPPTKSDNTKNPVKSSGPSVNDPKSSVKSDTPTKNTVPTKNTTTTKTETTKQNPPVKDPPKQNPPVKNDPPKYNPPPVKYDPPKYDPPKYDPPTPKYDPPPPPPVKNDPPPPPPVKNDPPPPPPKKDDDKKGD